MQIAVILAAGQSQRTGRVNKVFYKIKGKPLIFYTVLAFEKHPQIKKIILVARKKDFQNNAAQCNRPDQTKKRPTPRTPHSHERYRSIGSGNQQIYRNVIDGAEYALDPYRCESMIKSRRQKQDDQGRTVNAQADDAPGIAVLGGKYDQ